MFNVCYRCGEYRADKTVVPLPAEPGWANAICPNCGHPHRFRYLPLLVVSGASGTGKSALIQKLTPEVDEAVLLELDILWRPEFNRPEDAYSSYFDAWLRLAKNIAQAGKPVVVFGAGIGVPSNLEQQVELRYLAGVHTLALTCDNATLTERLRTRPSWRGCDSEGFIASQRRFNQWFIETGPTLSPPIELVDTSTKALDATAADVAAWIGRTVALRANAEVTSQK